MKKKLNTIESSVLAARIKKKGISAGSPQEEKKIDYSDIPEFSEKQLKKFSRPGRPILGESPRKAISLRLEEDVLRKIKAEAKKQGMAYQTLINEILKKAV